MTLRTPATLLFLAAVPLAAQQTASPVNPYLLLMEGAGQHARAHGGRNVPVLSPADHVVLDRSVPVEELHARGFRVVPWTTNDPGKMRELIRRGVDGIISDRPDLLRQVVTEARSATGLTGEDRERLARFDAAAHRGGRGLRPENTLPSFESGLDQLATTLETDTGVTTDHVSLIWHDQFLNPESCRRADGAAYTLANRAWIRDISMPEAQRTFVCDKLHGAAFPDQRNELALSPVAVAFAAREGMPSPYAPTYVEQLFRFVRFYAEYYRAGAGKGQPHAAERAANAERVRFNLETKILPDPLPTELTEGKAGADIHANHTVPAQMFVDTLAGAILRNHMEGRCEIQSFDFRTLLLTQEQHPEIPTYYLIEDARVLSTTFVPDALRQGR